MIFDSSELIDLCRGKVVGVVLLDLIKAYFDCVVNNQLQVKLEKYGLKGMINQLLQSYLSCRL